MSVPTTSERPSADQVIATLQAGSDELVPVAEALTAEQLRTPTRPGQWTLASVLSHLGSGAVITLGGLDAALAGQPNPGAAGAEPVWERWNAMEPEQQRDEFVSANAALMRAYDALDADTRASLRVDMGFLPAPLDLAGAALFRLDELALHSWDVRSALDPAATVQRDAVPLLVDQMLPMMIGWLAKADRLEGAAGALAVALADPERELGLVVSDDGITLGSAPEAPDGVLTMPAEAFLRLLTGRLDEAHTPAGVGVIGPVDLDTLRRAFPGF